MFRQITALVAKNLTLKLRRWPETLWEIVFPAFCGIVAGILSVDPKNTKDLDHLQLFGAISCIFLVAYLLISLSFLTAINYVVNELISERASRIKGSLAVMSLTKTAYTLGLFLSQSIITLITATVLSFCYLMANGNTYMTQSPAFTLYIAICLYGLALIAFAMAISTLFKDKTVVFSISAWLLMVPFAISLYCVQIRLADAINGVSSFRGFPITYIFPQFAFSTLLCEFYIEGGAMLILSTSSTYAWVCLALSTPFYLLVYVYLDSVLPSEQGVKQSLCCCFRRSKEVK